MKREGKVKEWKKNVQTFNKKFKKKLVWTPETTSALMCQCHCSQLMRKGAKLLQTVYFLIEIFFLDEFEQQGFYFCIVA